MTFIMKKKKYKFNVRLTVEELTSVPMVNSMLFVKCRLLEGGSFVDYTDRRDVDKHHCVKWNNSFEFTCKATANAVTGILDSCILRFSLRKETKGGKSWVKLGYADLNLTSLAGANLTRCRCLLEGYDSKGQLHRQDNSMLQVTLDIRLIAGDPCFKTPKATCLTQKQGSTDILLESELNESIKAVDQSSTKAPSVDPLSFVADGTVSAPTCTGLPVSPTSSLNGSEGGVLDLSVVGPPSSHHSTITSLANGTHSNQNTNTNNNLFSHGFDAMTSSATSNTNSVGSSFDPFETGHSRSNSSQTSCSRISGGFNSLPSHSRQGSADSENTSNSRHPAVCDIKFNSVDRVGKRHERSTNVKPVNGGGHGGHGSEELYLARTGKKAIDSTRVSADELVQELLQNNKLVDDSFLEEDTNGGLELYVSRDGSATIGSRLSRPDGVERNSNGASYAVVQASSRPHGNGTRKLNRV